MNEDSESFDFTSQFSPEGRLPQVEYATKATLKGETAIGMKGSDGFVLAVVKNTNELQSDTAGNSSIFKIDLHIGAVVAGLMPDARRIVNKARKIANDYRIAYCSPVPLNYLIQDISAYIHENTLQSSKRPLAASLIFGSYLAGETQLYSIKPSGDFEAYNGCAIGKAADAARSEMGRINFSNASIAELVKETVKIIYIVYDDQDDLELELNWCGAITDGKHVVVPPNVLEEAEDYAKEQIGGPSDSNNV